MQLTDDERQVLLMIARDAIDAAVRSREYNFDPGSITERLKIPLGAFVTLRMDGTLRGCIGYVESDMSLAATVTDVAVKAALEDPRFNPVEPSELIRLEIEISVLSTLEQVMKKEAIEIGVHGLYVLGEFNKGLLLPQVAVTHNWDTDTFIEQTGRKAGLHEYKPGSPGVLLYKFTADVFSESSLSKR